MYIADAVTHSDYHLRRAHESNFLVIYRDTGKRGEGLGTGDEGKQDGGSSGKPATMREEDPHPALSRRARVTALPSGL